MKKIILPGFLIIYMTLGSVAAFAQADKIDKKESREIIIRSNGDTDKKMKIEIDGDKVTVNGKPLSDYKEDDVTIIERDLIHEGSGDMLYFPKGKNRDFEFFNNDSKSFESKTFLGVITEKATNGVKINEVMKGSSAEKAGMKKGDVITKINDKNISNPKDLFDAVQSYKPNEEVKLYYSRDGKKSDMKVKLGERKESTRTFTFNDDNGFRNEDAYNFKKDRYNFKNDGYNFKMAPMPQIRDFPKSYFRYFNNNVKLGVKVEDAPDNAGAKIVNVEQGSAADKAGLKKDDIITEMNGEKVTNIDDVRSGLMDAEDKESYNLKAKRNNAEMNFEIKIPKPVNSADL